MTQTPRLALTKFRLGTEDFFLGSDQQGARAWQVQRIPAQTADPGPEQEIHIDDFTNGYGITFENLAGAYHHASGFDARSPGRLVTWPRFASTETFTSLDRRGWQFQSGNYLYIARGRYVCKYAIDPTRDAVWPIVEIHDLGVNCFCAGRPEIFKSKVYVPIVNTSAARQKFHELTTTATTTTEHQTITITGTPTSGTYVLHFDGKDTAAIAYNAPAATVQAALRLVAGLEKVTVSSSGSTPNFVHTVLMTAVGGSLAAASPPQMTVTDSTSGGAHNIAIATTSAGVSDTWTEGPSNREMQGFRRYKNLLAGAKGNKLYTVSGDPLVDGNWAPADGSGYEAGDSGHDVNDIAVWLNLLIGAKPEGLFSFDEQFNTVNEIPDLAAVVDPSNGTGTEMSNGFLLIPHINGMKRWQPGDYQDVGPQQEGFFEGDLDTPGWGRIISTTTSGKDAYAAMLNTYTNQGALVSLEPPAGEGQRHPLVPHMHDTYDGPAESVIVISQQTNSGGANQPTSASDDNTVGTITWNNPTNAVASDDSYAQSDAGAGITHYLKVLALASTVPSTATITGVEVSIERSVTA